MRIRILDSALEDLDRGRRFYERQGEGLGDYFLDSLFAEIDSLLVFAGIHREVLGYHRLIARRFPYAVYYRMDGERIVVVWRVLDLRQSPLSIRKALSG
jgi:plasmid stabilization system protein ParE